MRNTPASGGPAGPRIPARDRVRAFVRDGIMSGAFAAGTFLEEEQISAATGVSRTPVREALLRLEGEGLVRLYPKKGALVAPPTADEARDVLEARIVIEEWAARTVWPRRAELLDDLAVELEAMRATRRSGDITRLVEHDRRFHEIVVAAAGNAVLTRTYQGLRDRQLTIVAAAMRRSGERIDRAVDGHTELLSLLREGTVDAFVAATRHHVEDAMAHLQGQR